MARKIKPSKALADPREYRRSLGENQQKFWTKIGVTQSGGSRYENERNIPTPAKLLIVLLESGKITVADLAAARATVEASR